MSFSFFRVRNEKPEPRHSAIPVFLCSSERLFLHVCSNLFLFMLIQILVIFSRLARRQRLHQLVPHAAHLCT